MRNIFGLFVGFSLSIYAFADGLTLRDAVYIYDQPFDAKGSYSLIGVDCDVFKLVLDVKTGFSDLSMAESDSLNAALANQTAYPDRIIDTADMFAFSLYKNKSVKTFTFNDKNNPSSTSQIGTGTVFGYCYSSNPNAYVYLQGATDCKYNGFPPRAESLTTCIQNNSVKGSQNLKFSTEWLNGKEFYAAGLEGGRHLYDLSFTSSKMSTSFGNYNYTVNSDGVVNWPIGTFRVACSTPEYLVVAYSDGTKDAWFNDYGKGYAYAYNLTSPVTCP